VKFQIGGINERTILTVGNHFFGGFRGEFRMGAETSPDKLDGCDRRTERDVHGSAGGAI